MLWTILIVLIIVGAYTNNYTPLKVFGKIMAWFFGIIFVLCLVSIIIPKILDANNKKESEAYWEKVKQTPLIQWACDSDGYQLYLGEHPEYVYQCSTGKLIADLSYHGYICHPSYKKVNHWKFCKPNTVPKTNYDNLLGK